MLKNKLLSFTFGIILSVSMIGTLVYAASAPV
jgi:hypothetical protein